MEALIITTYILLFGAATYFAVSWFVDSVKIASYKRKYKHQEDQLFHAHLVNKELRKLRDELTKDRDEWRATAAHYYKLAKGVKPEEAKPTQFNKEQLTTLIQLCHPDKHGGRESANRMTQLLNDMRSKLK